MSDPEELHDGDVDVCPECRAVESFDNGRCRECDRGICHGCLSENVLIDSTHRCEVCATGRG